MANGYWNSRYWVDDYWFNTYLWWPIWGTIATSRIVVVASEDRKATIGSETRSLSVYDEDRRVVVEQEA